MEAILLYWFTEQKQTSALRRQQIGLFDVKFNVKFNELSLFFLKAARSSQKMAKTKAVGKNANWRRSETKG